MKQESLTTKIIIWAGICMFITAGIIVAYSVSTIRNTTLDSAKEETVAKAYGEAANIRGELSSPLDTARTIAQVLGKVRNPTNPLDIQREETFDLLRTILLDNEQFVGVYTCWEPNAYDFMDSGYRKERGHDISGRFAPYWQRNQVGAPTLRPLLTSQSHSSDGKPGAWYKKTKQSLQEYIRNPFPSLVTATLTTSTIQPILGNDQFYGIVGIDLNLSFIQTMADRFNFFANSGKMLVLSNNGTIAGFTGRPEAVGKHIEETDKNFAEFLPLMQMEMEFTIVKQGQLFAFVPLTINNSTAPWFVSISVPIDKVTETATILMQKQIILFVGILFALIILAAVGAHSIITKPLTSLLKGIQKIGDGDFTHEVKINSKDEIGELAEIFNQMRIKLKSIQDYLSNIIDSMPSLLVGVKPDGTITQWNKEAQKRTGISPENALGKPLYTIIPHLKAEMVKIAEAIETGQSQIDPKKIRYIEGKLCCEDITIYPLDGDGIEGAVIRVDDVSREYTLAEQLDQSRKMDAIGQLAGGVAHDFNNMLAGIMGAAQLLKSPKRNLDRRSIEFVDMILGASERAADLTTKLLAFGRKKSIAPTDIDVHNTIDDAVAILDKTIDKKISISTRKEANNSIILGDDTELQNIFINLGINALYAMPDGGELSFETKNIQLNDIYCDESPFEIKAGHFIEIEVRDTGCGIDPNNIRRIFEPFFTTKEQGKGTGLGLAAAYGTVQNHHGAITVYSEIGTGTAFHIYLPSLTTGSKALPLEHNNLNNRKVITGTGNILLVDDESIVRITGAYMLEEMGYKVILAENGLEAVKIFTQQHKEIDLVITDMIMPKMSGTEMFHELKKIDKNCKVIMSSGFTKDENLNDLKKAGLAGFISKPFSDVGLSHLIAKVHKSSL